MKGKLAEMLQEAWEDGREAAVEKLAGHGRPGNSAAENRLRRSWRLRLPQECPYSLEGAAGYDPYDKKARPRDEVWPAAVARVLNQEQGTDYPVRFDSPERGPGRSR